jgi:hypothetical protein
VCSSATCLCPTPVSASAIRETDSASYASNSPAIASNGTQAAILFTVSSIAVSGGTNLHVAILNADGTRANSGDVVLTSFADGATSSAYMGDIVATSSGWAVVWTQTGGTSADGDIMFQALAANGTPQGTPTDVTALTPGPAASPDWVRLAYDPSEGFAIVSALTSGGASFQLLGMNGTEPQAVNSVPVNGTMAFQAIAAAPSGSGWGVVAQSGQESVFQPFNADGSQTVSPTTLSTSIASVSAVRLAYDGATWVTAWTESRETSQTMAVVVARGPSLATRADVQTAPASGTVPFREASVAVSGADVSVVWETANSLGGPDQAQLARFRAPSDANAALVELTDPMPLVTTQTIYIYTLAAAAMGPASLLTTWADTRWGHNEIYAQSTDFLSCQ